MADLRLESVWYDRLKGTGWTDRSSRQISFHWAESTISAYDRQINKFASFCRKRIGVFPPADKDISAVLADFLCVTADSSDRPESVLKVTSAAISCYYHGKGMKSPMDCIELRTLVSALIKSGTKRPAGRTPIMPAEVFSDLFRSWPDNEALDTAKLRLKAVTLLALSLMTRPSDLAPKATIFDAETGTKEPLVFARNQVTFHEDGSATFRFFGIKNDHSRTGFEVRIPGSLDPKVDPIRTLSFYFEKTGPLVGGSPTAPVFISLRPPYKGITGATIANVLGEAIKAAGLSGRGFSAKSFRPTGATAAVKSGAKPETVMQIGRWKTDTVFRERYVYPLAESDYTDNILSFKGLDSAGE